MNGDNAPQLPPIGGGFSVQGQDQQPSPVSDPFVPHLRQSPQPHESSHFQPQSDFPIPEADRQTIWSQMAEVSHGPIEDGPRGEAFVEVESSDTMAGAFGVHGLPYADIPDRQDPSTKRQEEAAKETEASLVNIPTEPPPPLHGDITTYEREGNRGGGIGAAVTGQDRQESPVEERQHTLVDLWKQQPETVQNGSIYGSQPSPGLNLLISNLIMMGMNPVTTVPQQAFAAQLAAAQAYQQTMMSFGQNMRQSQAGGGTPDGGAGGKGNPRMLSPMMTGQFDPRMSMMGMMGMGMNMGMDLGPVNPMMTEDSEMGPGMGGMGGGMGAGGGLATQTTGESTFGLRLSPQFGPGGSANP